MWGTESKVIVCDDAPLLIVSYDEHKRVKHVACWGCKEGLFGGYRCIEPTDPLLRNTNATCIVCRAIYR